MTDIVCKQEEELKMEVVELESIPRETKQYKFVSASIIKIDKPRKRSTEGKETGRQDESSEDFSVAKVDKPAVEDEATELKKYSSKKYKKKEGDAVTLKDTLKTRTIRDKQKKSYVKQSDRCHRFTIAVVYTKTDGSVGARKIQFYLHDPTAQELKTQLGMTNYLKQYPKLLCKRQTFCPIMFEKSGGIFNPKFWQINFRHRCEGYPEDQLEMTIIELDHFLRNQV